MAQVGYNSADHFGRVDETPFCELRMAQILAAADGGIEACKRYFLSKVAILSNGDFAVYSGKSSWRVEGAMTFSRVKLKAKESAARARAREREQALAIAQLAEGEPRPDKIQRWELRSWVNSSTIKSCLVAFDPARPLVFMSSGECYLNSYSGRLHALDIPAFAAAPEEARAAVNLFLRHLELAVCSADAATFKYMLLWTAAVEAGVKTSKQLWVHSAGQGIGKSLYAETLRKHVIGEKMFNFQAGATRTILGDFNESLAKKIIVVFDDPALNSIADARKFEEGLRSITTASTIYVNPKGTSAYEIENRCNFVVTSNYSAYAQTSGVRRTVFIKGDSAKYAQEDGKRIDGLPYDEYYDRLYTSTETEGFGQALVAHLRELRAENPAWTPAKMPSNDARAEAVIRSAPLFVKFLLETFLTPGRIGGGTGFLNSINKTTTSELRTMYAQYCKENGVGRVPGTYEATKKLKEIDAGFGETYGARRYFKATTEALLKKLSKYVEPELWEELSDCVTEDFLRKAGCPAAVMAKIAGKAAAEPAAAAAAAEPAAAGHDTLLEQLLALP